MAIYSYTKKVKGKDVVFYRVVYRKKMLEGNKQTTKNGFRTQREAREFEAGRIAFKEKSTSMRLEDLVKEYIEYKSKRVSKSTHYKNTIILKKVVEFFGNPPLNKITNLFINEHIMKSNYGNTKLNTYVGYLKMVLNFAVNLYEIDVDQKVLEFKKLINDKEEKREILTISQYKELIDFLNLDSRRKDLIIPCHLMFYGGLRKGEVLSLTAGDIKNGGVDVNKTLSVDMGKMKVKKGAKTKSSNRFISLPKWVYDKIIEYIQLYELKPNENLFWFHQSKINEILKTFSKNYGVNVSPHFLRHSHASILLSEGMPITAVSKRLGHQNIQITMQTYIHLINKDVEKLDEFIFSL